MLIAKTAVTLCISRFMINCNYSYEKYTNSVIIEHECLYNDV